MSKTMIGLLAALLAVALALIFDTPPDAETVAAAPRKARRAQVVPASMPIAAAAASDPDPDAPVPDLFAAQAGAGSLAQNEGGAAPVVAPEQAPQVEFRLIGFKEEDGVRVAYLLRDGALLVARAGAVFDQRYRVQAVRADAVHITDIRSGKTLRIGYEEE